MSIFDFAAGTNPPMADAGAICSRKACRVQASWQILWNNPKIHTPERRKSWLACDEHRESLSDFLGARGFLKDVVPHSPAG